MPVLMPNQSMPAAQISWYGRRRSRHWSISDSAKTNARRDDASGSRVFKFTRVANDTTPDYRAPALHSGYMTKGTAQRQLLLVALAALLALGVLAVWAATLAPAGWEPGVLAGLALGQDAWGTIVRVVNFLGNPPVWAAIVITIAVAMWITRGRAAGVLVALTLASDVAAFAIKVVVGRERPDTAVTHQFFGIDSFSFPSGHVVRAVALAAVLAWLLAPATVRLWAALLAAAGAWLVMGYARVSLGVHWPTDTLGGALLGVAWFAATAAIVAPLGAERIKREKSAPPAA